jgi:hypothetical protein
VGVARRLAVNPPDPKFARRLHGAYGGHVTARRCRAAGIPHPRIVAMQIAKRRQRYCAPLPSAQILL